MKLQRALACLILSIVVIVTGCTVPASATVAPTEPQPVHIEATATDLPPKTVTPTIAPVTGPAMEVGSTHYYVDGTTLVAVPAGEFLMGADGEDNPEHTVNLADYWIYSTKVTNRQYALCEALGNCTAPNPDDNPRYSDNSRANDPVVGVTYEQAAAYCSFMQGRLPTEAEWEKSARHPDGGPYPWGGAAPGCDLLNFNNCVGETTNVVNYPSGTSYYGNLEMAGNAFEWVADWYAADYYASSPIGDPQGPSSGSGRSVRSSSYASEVDQIPVAIRSAEEPQNHRPDLSFRCVIEDPTSFAPFCESPLAYEIGASDATQPADSCPELDIKQAPYCAGKLPLTNVKFVGPSDSTIDSSNCIPSDDPNLFTCQAPGTIVSITTNCQSDLAGTSWCPEGYSQEDNQCVSSGSAGQCLDGNYDSATQCCKVQDATDLGSVSVVCPVGTFYSKTQDACLSYPIKEIVSVFEDVLFASCSSVGSGGGGGGGGGGGSCQEPPEGCLSSVWIPEKCCCSFIGDGSDCP